MGSLFGFDAVGSVFDILASFAQFFNPLGKVLAQNLGLLLGDLVLLENFLDLVHVRTPRPLQAHREDHAPSSILPKGAKDHNASWCGDLQS